MLSNYFKIAIRALGRKKFFTFISLFGISFTLGILMLIVSYIQSEIGSSSPISNQEKWLIVNYLTLERVVQDTIPVIDSTKVAGMMKYDTTYTYDDRTNSMSRGAIGLNMIEKYLQNIPSAEKSSFFFSGANFNAFVNESKVILKAVYTDASFWEIFDFEFIEGFGYGQSSFDQAEPVAVISEELAKEYFGQKKGIIGKEVLMNGQRHKVIGVIKKPSVTVFTGNIFAPYSLAPRPPETERLGGPFIAIFQAKDASSLPLLKADLDFAYHAITPPEDFNKLTLEYSTYNEAFAMNLMQDDDPEKSYQLLWFILGGLISLFVILPTLNLINLNVSRILERSSEIGVRKAFGANKVNLLIQFIFENIVQTLIGGLIGFLIAVALIYYINSAQLLGDTVLKIDTSFYLISFLICILFGVLSGALPAYRMSRMHIVQALKSNQL